MKLSGMGLWIYSYAKEIFQLGDELKKFLKLDNPPTG